MPNDGNSDATANMTGNVLLMHLNDNVSGVYNASLSDNFNAGSLDSKWTILRDDGKWTASGNTLDITTNGGDFWTYVNTAPLFWQSINASENYEVTVDVTATPDYKYEQGGIFFYEDDDNYVRLTYIYDGAVRCYLSKEIAQSFSSPAISSCPDGGVTLKLRKVGTRYSAYYSTDDGATYTYVGSTTASITASKIGLSAFNHAGELFVFDNFDVYELPTNVEDSSGTGNNGTNYGASVATGKFNGAFEFDGSSGYVDCGNDASLPQTTAFTVSAWVKLNSLNQGWKVITDKYGDATHVTLSVFLSDDNTFSFTTANGIWNSTSDLKTGTVSANRWYHVVAVWNGTTKLIYLDGDLSNSVNPTSSYGPGAGTGNFSLGARVDGSFCLNGVIDEVAIWNRSLSGDEILDLYRRAVIKPVDSSDCVYLDSFDTTDLDTIYYSSRNSSYSKACFSINNSHLGGINTSDTFYIAFVSETTVYRFCE
jgi:regulation of enolase protein 1 (concanavalin A-like superfamily)